MVLTTSKNIFYKIDKILGTKIIIAPISAAKQRINVALLAVSFAILAKGCNFGETKSTTASNEEFINSTAIISPIIKMQNNHSLVFIFNNIPVMIVIKAAINIVGFLI